MTGEPKLNHNSMLLKNRNGVVNLFLMLTDILMVSAAMLLATLTRYLLGPILGGEIIWPLILNGLIFYGIFIVGLAWINGLYPGFGLPAVQEMQKVLYVVSLGIVVLGVFLFLQQLGDDYSRAIFILTWIFSALFMMLGRFALRNRLSRYSWWGIPMIVVGSAASVVDVIEKLQETRRLGYRPVYYYVFDETPHQQILGVEPIESQAALLNLISQSKLQHVIFTDPIADFNAKDYGWMRDVFPNIYFIIDTASFGSLWVRPIDVHGTLVIETNYHLLNKKETVIKRGFDLTLSLLLLLVTWPIFLILAVLVRIDSKGPVLFTQKRLGQGRNLFDSYKFRTMFENADAILQDLLAMDEDARQEYQVYHKLAKDPRVTRVGKLLRRYSLDEMPQFINVLKGDMNLIGPRSYLPRELPAMGTSANVILKVKPGITGWWQVMGRNATSFKERLQLDEYYISNWSIWLDIYIMIKTVWVLIKGEGL